MDNKKKSSAPFCVVFTALSLFQLFIIHNVLSSDTAKKTVSQLHIDGSDFSPIISLISSGAKSLAFSISVFSAFLWAVFVSLIVSCIVKRIFRIQISNEQRSHSLIITFFLSLFFFFIGCVISSFKIIDTVLFMYIPVPIISSLVFFTSNRKQNK